MTNTVRSRVLQGLGANAFNQVVTMAVQLVTVPLLLYAWGAQLYGEWLILFAVPAFLSMTDLGFSISAGNDMTARVARGDRPGALVVFQSLNALIGVIIGVGLFVIAAFSWQAPLDDWLTLRAMDLPTARWVLLLLAADVLIHLYDGVTHAGFRACGDYARHIALHATVRLLQFLGLWVTALAGGGPAEAAASFLAVRALTTPAIVVYLKHRHSWLVVGISFARLTELHRLLRPAIANAAIPIAHALNVQGMVIAVGAVLGPLAVVAFSTLRTLTRLVFNLILVVGRAAEPELATAFGAEDRSMMKSLFVYALRTGTWLGLGAVLALALFGPSILSAWTHGKVTLDPVLYATLLGSAFASVLWQTPLFALRAANAHVRAAPVYMLASAGALLTGWLGMHATGEIYLAGLALLGMDALFASYVMGSACRLLMLRLKPTLLEAINPVPLLLMLLRLSAPSVQR
jgi:O-antigen/teichoic acid export membrane protein